MQINLQVQWLEKRINILDVLKPTEEEIAKYYKRQDSEGFIENDEGSSDNKSPNKFPTRSNEDFDHDREELNNSLKRNQKPSMS